MTIDLAVVALILVLQPLLLVVYVYVAYRAAVAYTTRRTGSWVDDRIEKAKEAAKQLR